MHNILNAFQMYRLCVIVVVVVVAVCVKQYWNALSMAQRASHTIATLQYVQHGKMFYLFRLQSKQTREKKASVVNKKICAVHFNWLFPSIWFVICPYLKHVL